MTVQTLSNFNNGGFKMGSGRTGVLLIHGLCGSPTEMRFVANGLARAGHTVHVPYFAGLGGSVEELKEATWQDWVKAAEQALDEIAAECDTVMVGGLSTGAVIALLLAARHPDKVQSLALYTPTLWLNGFRIPWYAKLFRIVTFRAFAGLFDFPAPHKFGIKCPRIREFLNAAMAAGNGPKLPPVAPGETVLERRWLVDAARKVLGSIKQPTVILHPREDDYAALNNATWLQKKLGGLVDLVVLDDSYHIVTVDRQRQTVLDHTVALASRSLAAATAEVIPLSAAA
jgi:carboxylesterase